MKLSPAVKATPDSASQRSEPSFNGPVPPPASVAVRPDPRTSCQSAKAIASVERRAITRLSGCCERRASAAASVRGAGEPVPGRASSAATSGLPAVSVPVLSKRMAVISPAFSSAMPSRIRMPRRAAALAPAMMAAGVARPIAQGQATIKTPAAMIKPAAAPMGKCACQRNGINASCTPLADAGASPHHKPAASAMPTMTGTKTLLMRSPRRWMFARLFCARCTAAMM